MSIPEHYPYRSAEARELCLRALENLAASQWPAASEQRMVPTRFGATFVRITGPPEAPLLLLLHGAGSTSLMWAPNVAALSRQYRTVAVDQVGEFGRSACTMPPESMQDLMSWLDDLIAALQPRQPVTLVGMSYGGALAAQYALHAPGRLGKLVLLAPGATVLRPPAAFWLRLLVLALLRKRGLHWFFRWIFADMARRDPPWVQRTVDQLALNLASVQRHKVPMPPVLTGAEWARLSVPTLFLVGENEVIYSARKAVLRLRQAAPQVTAEIVPCAGHDLTFVQAEWVNGRILRFLNNAASPSAVL